MKPESYDDLYRVRWRQGRFWHSKFIYGRDDALDEQAKIWRLLGPNTDVKVTGPKTNPGTERTPR